MKARDGGRAAEMQRDEDWNRCREQRVTLASNRKALITASSDVGGSHRKVRSAAEKRVKGQTLEPMSETACVVLPKDWRSMM
jgi:hypothetical protein